MVRALRVLRQEGWIEPQTGKWSFVRGRPAPVGAARARPGQVELDRDETRETGELISADMAYPPRRVAKLLGIRAGDRVLCRQRLVSRAGEPSEIVTWWIPASLSEGTPLADPTPLAGSIRDELARRKGVRADHIVEQVTARHPSTAEAKLLAIKQTTPLLAL